MSCTIYDVKSVKIDACILLQVIGFRQLPVTGCDLLDNHMW